MRLRNDPFIRHNAVFMAGNVAVGFLNYIFYPVMGRLLQPTYFGEVQALFSIIAHIGVFFNVLGLVVVNIVTNHPDAKTANRLIVNLEKLALRFSVGSFLLFLLLVLPLQDFFHFTSPWPFVGLALAILLSVPLTFRRAVLQGIHDFWALSWAGVLNGASKLAAAAALVLAGYKTVGAMGALLLAQVLSLLYIDRQLKKTKTKYQWSGYSLNRPDMELVRPELKYARLVMLVSLIFTVMYSIDVLMVKHYFAAEPAGLYAGISTIANTIYFISGSVAGVLLASVRISSAENAKLLKRSLFITFVLGGAVLLVFTLAPRPIINLLIGSTYGSFAHYLPSASLALFLASIANLLFIYHMALRNYRISWLVLGGALLIFGLMLTNHGSIQAIINNVIISSLALLVGIGLLGLNDIRTSSST